MTNREKLNELIAKANKECGTHYSARNYDGWAKAWLDMDVDDPSLADCDQMTNPYCHKTFKVSPFVYCLVQIAYACCDRYNKAQDEFFRGCKSKQKEMVKYATTLDFAKTIVNMEDHESYFNLLD